MCVVTEIKSGSRPGGKANFGPCGEDGGQMSENVH